MELVDGVNGWIQWVELVGLVSRWVQSEKDKIIQNLQFTGVSILAFLIYRRRQ